MSIRDYYARPSIVNEATNEKIIVPQVLEENNTLINVSMKTNDFLFMNIVLDEYKRTGRITITKEYVKE